MEVRSQPNDGEPRRPRVVVLAGGLWKIGAARAPAPGLFTVRAGRD
jgi:hypothetical protein